MYEIKTGRNALVPEAELKEFYEELKVSEFVISEKEFDNGVYASLDWLIPSAFGVYILKPYFDAFLKEAGKEHYQVLKNAITDKVVPKFLIENAPLKVKMVTSGDKVKENFFSGSFSISSSINYSDRNVQIKLLFPENSNDHYCAKAIDKFSSLVSKYTDEELGDLIQKNSKYPINTSCFWYNSDSDQIELLDVIESSKKKKIISALMQ
jgi:hypothetical protein